MDKKYVRASVQQMTVHQRLAWADTKAMAATYKWKAQVFPEKAHALFHHKTRATTSNGMVYYRTFKNKEAVNRVFLLWAGENTRMLKESIVELKFCYDHASRIDFVILAGWMLQEAP